MKTTLPATPSGRFEKVGECLYRYSSNGVYYALLKHHGKQKRTSLETTDKAFAKRKLADLKRGLSRVDTAVGRVTLQELCDRFRATIQSNHPTTRARKEAIIDRLLKDLPGGGAVAIGKIKPSTLEAWIASYHFGYASHNLYQQCLRSLFDLAVHDRLLAESPAAHIKCRKVVKPVRTTPTFEEFWKIIESVRAQTYSNDAQNTGDFLEFMGLAGVGQAELGNLTRADVDFKKAQIRLYRVKTSTPYFIPLYPQLKPLLERMKVEAMPHHQHVVAIKDAKIALTTACKRLGMPRYSQRSLRRMFITRCIELGIDVKVVADWQGHKDGGKLILATYSHVRKTHADDMAKKLALV